MKTATILAALMALAASAGAAEKGLAIAESADRVAITHDGQPVATYVFRDEKILRPYFAHLHAPGAIQITRNHPPKAGVDAADHDTMHPGLWLAFGDINGQDFWRNKGTIRHERFIERPAVREGRASFAAENSLVSADGKVIGTQVSRVTIEAKAEGYLIAWEATFEPRGASLVFGDQEEMGLGVRVATPITEKSGGTLTASDGTKGAQKTWGKSLEWCDYSGTIGGRRVGVTITPDPANFRKSWFHNRDYGLMVANPFGRKALTGGEASRVEVKEGDKLQLRFGVLVHGPTGPNRPGE